MMRKPIFITSGVIPHTNWVVALDGYDVTLDVTFGEYRCAFIDVAEAHTFMCALLRTLYTTLDPGKAVCMTSQVDEAWRSTYRTHLPLSS